MLLSPGLCFAGACDFPLLSAVEEEEVGIRKSFARRLYLWNYSQGQTIIMKFYFYKVQFFFFFLTMVMSVFLHLVETFRNSLVLEGLFFLTILL